MRRPDLIRELDEIYAIAASPEARRAPDHVKCELEFRKWRHIHKLVHGDPFPTNATLARSDQWRRVVDYARKIGEIEVLDWVLEQVEVARHLEQGIQDLRPRKNGPCHCLLLEYVSNRKRKAHAIYRWTLAARDRHRPSRKDAGTALGENPDRPKGTKVSG